MAATRLVCAHTEHAATDAIDPLNADLTTCIATPRPTAIRRSSKILEIAECKVAHLSIYDQGFGALGVEAPGAVRL